VGRPKQPKQERGPERSPEGDTLCAHLHSVVARKVLVVQISLGGVVLVMPSFVPSSCRGTIEDRRLSHGARARKGHSSCGLSGNWVERGRESANCPLRKWPPNCNFWLEVVKLLSDRDPEYVLRLGSEKKVVIRFAPKEHQRGLFQKTELGGGER